MKIIETRGKCISCGKNTILGNGLCKDCFDNDGKPKIKNPDAVALGKLGGLKGGKARAAKLTKEQRKTISKKAINTRWCK